MNPVLREGNSDRRVASAVKEYAKNNPHPMGEWTSESQSHVAYMRDGDFYGSEQSVVSAEDDTLKIEFVDTDGNTTGSQRRHTHSGWRSHRCNGHELSRTARILRNPTRKCKKRGYFIFTPPQSHHDESIRPDPFWACGLCLLQRCI